MIRCGMTGHLGKREEVPCCAAERQGIWVNVRRFLAALRKDKGIWVNVMRFLASLRNDKGVRYFSTLKRHHKTQLMMVDWIEEWIFVDVGEAIGIAYFGGNNNVFETVFYT